MGDTVIQQVHAAIDERKYEKIIVSLYSKELWLMMFNSVRKWPVKLHITAGRISKQTYSHWPNNQLSMLSKTATLLPPLLWLAAFTAPASPHLCKCAEWIRRCQDWKRQQSKHENPGIVLNVKANWQLLSRSHDDQCAVCRMLHRSGLLFSFQQIVT